MLNPNIMYGTMLILYLLSFATKKHNIIIPRLIDIVAIMIAVTNSINYLYEVTDDGIYSKLKDPIQRLLYKAYLVTKNQPINLPANDTSIIPLPVWNNAGKILLSINDLYVEKYKLMCINFPYDKVPSTLSNYSCNSIVDINNNSHEFNNNSHEFNNKLYLITTIIAIIIIVFVIVNKK